MKKVLGILLISLLIFGIFTTFAFAKKPFEGQTIVIATMVGPQIVKPVLMHYKEWEEKTGGKVKIVTFPYGDLYEKLITSFITGTHSFDVIIYASDWSGDIMGPGYVMEVPKDPEIDKLVDWNDVVPLYRNRLLGWAGKRYAFPYDGDCHMIYYRKDLVENPEYRKKFKEKYGYELGEPKTWKQYKDFAEFFNGWDWDGDGEVEYGVAEAMVRHQQSYWTFISHATAYAKYPGNPSFFFNVKDMKPVINSPGYVRGLEDYVEMAKYGPPGILNFSIGEVRSYFVSGKVALALDWGDIGTMSIDPKQSVVKGKVGFAKLPGSPEVFNLKTNKWEKMDKPNYAPYIAFGGWIISVTKTSKHRDAAISFASFLGSKKNSLIDVVTPETGVNPLRYSQFENLKIWTDAGFDEESAQDYLGAIKGSITDPNAVLDLRIPGSARYFDVLDQYVTMALAKQLPPKAALDMVAKEWDKITNEIGKKQQLKLFRESLNVKEVY